MSSRSCIPAIASLLVLAAGSIGGCDPAPEQEAAPAFGEEGATPASGEFGTAPSPVGAAADCCAADGTSGCTDVAVESCVCDADPYCCNVAWDGLCVNEVDSLGCGSCSAPPVACCETGGAGCGVPSVESCVCDTDPYCCNVAWDGLCVSEVESLGCGTCTSPTVDLLVTQFDAPSTACVGEDIGGLVELDVANGGSSDVTSTFQVGWYLSSDDTLGSGDRLLLGGRDQITSLMAGGVTSVSVNANQIPSDVAPGAQFLIVSVDEFDGITESDEDNNIVVLPITIDAVCTEDHVTFEDCDGASDFDCIVDTCMGSANCELHEGTSCQTVDTVGGGVAGSVTITDGSDCETVGVSYCTGQRTFRPAACRAAGPNLWAVHFPNEYSCIDDCVDVDEADACGGGGGAGIECQ